MKMDQLYRRFRGTVRFTAEGGHALRMPGLLAADGIPLYGVTPTDLGFEAEIAAEHYRKAAKAARRTGTRIRLREKHGISFWLFRNRKRRGLFAGILAAVLVIGLAATAVWRLFFRSAGDSGVLTEAFGVPVITEWIPENTPGRPGIQRTVKYVVIHETGNPSEGANAQRHSAFLLSGGEGETSWHYTVDDHEIYHHIPDNEVAWHAGDKEKEDGGNLCGIGVELCVNEDGNFESTFENGARLTARLLQIHHLELSAVKQHGDFIEKNCPQTIRDNGRWQEFLGRVSYYLEQGEG